MCMEHIHVQTLRKGCVGCELIRREQLSSHLTRTTFEYEIPH